jgi:large subunit ribosomal protein L14
MLNIGTIVKSADNSGVNTAKCIKNLGGSKKKTSKLGDYVKITIKRVKSKTGRQKILKGEMFQGLVVATKVNSKRVDGSYVKFNSNRIITVNNNKTVIGNRIIGPICKEIRGA